MSTRTAPHRARSAPVRTRKRRRIPAAAAGGVLVAIAGLLAVLIAGGAGEKDTRLVAAPVTITGAPLPVAGAGPDPAVGMQIPSVTGSRFDGSPISIATGRPIAIVFLAHWCPHCQEEVRIVGPWLDRGNVPEGVDVISVVIWSDPARPNYPPGAWLARERWPVPELLDDADGSVAKAFGVSGTPTWVFVDGSGAVVARASGDIGIDGVRAGLASLAP